MAIPIPPANWVTAELAEHSLLFVFLSAVVGGLIGASAKYIFEFLLPEGFKERREARLILLRYRNPILKASDALYGRIRNLLAMENRDWLSQSEYYRLSTLYVFGCYFAWMEILFGKLATLRMGNSKKERQLNVLLTQVEKAFNNRSYFGDLAFSAIPADTDVPKFACKALGELLVVERGGDREPRGFVGFCDTYRSDVEFRAWYSNLDCFLAGLTGASGQMKHDRLSIIGLSLIALINFLDPRHELTREAQIDDVNLLIEGINSVRAKDVFSSDCKSKCMNIGRAHLLPKRKTPAKATWRRRRLT